MILDYLIDSADFPSSLDLVRGPRRENSRRCWIVSLHVRNGFPFGESTTGLDRDRGPFSWDLFDGLLIRELDSYFLLPLVLRPTTLTPHLMSRGWGLPLPMRHDDRHRPWGMLLLTQSPLFLYPFHWIGRRMFPAVQVDVLDLFDEP